MSRRRLLAVSVVAAPAAAWACGMCANTQLHQRWWALGAVVPAVVVLVLELFVARAAPTPKGWRRGLAWALVLLGVGLGLAGAMVAPVLGGLGLALTLLVRALAVGAMTWKEAPRAVALRLGVLTLALGGCVAAQAPSLRATDELVRLLVATPYRFEDDSWALAQVLARPREALPLVESRLARLGEGSMARAVVVTLELHQRLGGEAEVREPGCAVAAEPQGTEDAVIARRVKVCGDAGP